MDAQIAGFKRLSKLRKQPFETALRNWYEENKDYILQKAKENYEENKEQKNEYQKQYAKKNSEHISETQKEYREKNKEKLTEQKKEYREAHDGQEPSGADLAAINAEAENVGNSSFLLNTALLSATNYIQFPKILGSSYKAEKNVINGLTREIGEITKDATGKIIVKAPTTKFGKLLSVANKIRPYTFSASEAFEEGAQYAIQVGTQDYYNKKYKGDATTFLDSLTEGVGKTLGTNEGMENVLIGGLSGSLMQARGTFREQREESKNTVAAVAGFNKFRLSDFTKETIDSVNRGTVLQQEREETLNSLLNFLFNNFT
jgi:hypothetical protein